MQKRFGVLALFCSLLVVNSVFAGSFFEGGLWDDWLTGQTVQKNDKSSSPETLTGWFYKFFVVNNLKSPAPQGVQEGCEEEVSLVLDPKGKDPQQVCGVSLYLEKTAPLKNPVLAHLRVNKRAVPIKLNEPKQFHVQRKAKLWFLLVDLQGNRVKLKVSTTKPVQTPKIPTPTRTCKETVELAQLDSTTQRCTSRLPCEVTKCGKTIKLLRVRSDSVTVNVRDSQGSNSGIVPFGQQLKLRDIYIYAQEMVPPDSARLTVSSQGVAPQSTQPSSPSREPQHTCLDSDGGRNYATKGSLTYSLPENKNQFATDNCAGSSLLEYLCNDPINHALNFETYYCKNGCRDGACLNEPARLPPLEIKAPEPPTPIPIFLIEDDGSFVPTPRQVEYATITRRFFVDHPDEYDFISIFMTNYPVSSSPTESRSARVKNDPSQGLGSIDSEVRNPYLYGSTPQGKLKDVTYIQTQLDLNYIQINPEELVFRRLLHEIGHYWAVNFGNLYGEGGLEIREPRDFTGGSTHWWRGLQTIREFDAVSKAGPWKDNGDGTFTIPPHCSVPQPPPVYGYSPFTLYLMGLADPEEIIQPFLLIKSDELLRNECQETVRGTAQRITITDIINTIGKRRTITTATSQKDFRMVFFVLYPKGTIFSEQQKNAIIWIANEFPKKWAKATSCRSTINGVTMTPTECATTVFPKKPR